MNVNLDQLNALMPTSSHRKPFAVKHPLEVLTLHNTAPVCYLTVVVCCFYSSAALCPRDGTSFFPPTSLHLSQLWLLGCSEKAFAGVIDEPWPLETKTENTNLDVDNCKWIRNSGPGWVTRCVNCSNPYVCCCVAVHHSSACLTQGIFILSPLGVSECLCSLMCVCGIGAELNHVFVEGWVGD